MKIIDNFLDHEDLDIWLKREYKFGIIPKDFFCEIYGFGTLMTSSGGGDFFGDPDRGSWNTRVNLSRQVKVSHRKGRSVDNNELTKMVEKNHIKIGDATFEIL